MSKSPDTGVDYDSPAHTLLHSLQRVVQGLRDDADAVEALADLIRKEANAGADYRGSYLGANVASTLLRTLNTSSYIGAVESAIYQAWIMTRGAES